MSTESQSSETAERGPNANPLRALPSVHTVLEHAKVGRLIAERGRDAVTAWIRDALGALRSRLSTEERASDRETILDEIAEWILQRAGQADRQRIGRVINATGVILHTGLGRAPLSKGAEAALLEIAGAGNVEIDLETGERHHRGHQLQPVWKSLTGCEDSLVVNNNAAATLLTLQALCAGREVIISRGQLIEIGGSFRLPEIFELSGARLREVGTTNRTRLSDYARAIGPETAAIMHVHPSNYRVIGFTETPDIKGLAQLARKHDLLAIDDIGSGSLVDVTKFGLPAEPTFSESIAHGADVVLGSGDKLLGGPQAGIILGKTESVGRIRRHPLARAVRVDKLTLAALAATLDSYQRGTADAEIPTLALLAAPVEGLLRRAESLKQALADLSQFHVEVGRDMAPVGGGSLPGAELPTAVLCLVHSDSSADELARRLRLGEIRIFGRIQHERVLIDLRSVSPGDDSKIIEALRTI